MLLVKAFLKIFSVCSKLMKFALKRRKFAFLNRNKDADWREGENKKEDLTKKCRPACGKPGGTAF